ncbi:hypothetical protein [Pseudonocardia sp. KRD291]|uniref:hypothetical protein n=1 Tax=Pseudonocardia sp. KRD291 TaxID=2792007 RepID=UPI001C49F0E4|nr:hypothetical protein [Pseudonocardia sp. KRD291]MBW0106421.1 hypothetical protein [Pseudonocardia sp. KRD291]
MNRRAPTVADAESEQNALVTCARDGRNHVVAHVVLADSLAAGTGQCTAVCGHVVLPASLSSPPGSRCLLCTEASGVGTEPRREPRRRWGASRATPGRTLRASY